MTRFEQLIRDTENKIDDVTNFFKHNENLIDKIQFSAIDYYNYFLKSELKNENLNETDMLYYYLLDCFYYNCITNHLNVFERLLSNPEKGFTEITKDQKKEQKYNVPTIEEIKYVFLCTNWNETRVINVDKTKDYDEIFQFLIKEYGLPLEENKKQIEKVSKVLEDLILKSQIENLNEQQTYKMLDYLTLAITSEISTIDMDIEELKQRYSEFPISYESDVYYQKWKEDKKYSERILSEFKNLKDMSEIKKYVISTLLPRTMIQERELDIYSSKKIVEQNKVNGKQEQIVSIIEEGKKIKGAQENINSISEQQSDLEQLYEMESFKEFLQKVELTRDEFKRAYFKLKDLSKTFMNSIFLLNEQVNSPTSVKKNDSSSISKTNEILSTKFKEDKENFELIKESVELLKKSFYETVKNQLTVIDVVYPIYNIVKNSEKGITTDEQVIDFFAIKMINDNTFNIRTYIESVSKKINNESLQKIEIAQNNIVETSSELFPESKKEDKIDVDLIVSGAEKMNQNLEMSKEQNNLKKEELEILLEYAKDLKELSDYYTPLQVEQKLAENYFELEKNGLGEGKWKKELEEITKELESMTDEELENAQKEVKNLLQKIESLIERK